MTGGNQVDRAIPHHGRHTREREVVTRSAMRAVGRDNTELTRVLATAHRVLGRKVAVAGTDACLMPMLEVAYQLREHAQVLVGSKEVEPGPGWPHAAILGDLAAPFDDAGGAWRHRGEGSARGLREV